MFNRGHTGGVGFWLYLCLAPIVTEESAEFVWLERNMSKPMEALDLEEGMELTQPAWGDRDEGGKLTHRAWKDPEEEGPRLTKPAWRKRWEKFFNDSSYNAALYIFASKSWLKRAVWAAVVLTAIGGFATITVLNIMRLVQEPTSTSIALKREQTLPFPAVTICSLSLLNTTLLGPDTTDDLDRLFHAVIYQSDLEQCRQRANNIAVETRINVSWGELTELVGNNIDQLLKVCTYGGDTCTVGDFEPINTVAGRCFTFNRPRTSAPLRTTQGTGIRRGLRLQLSPDDQLFTLGGDHGYRIIIHNPDERPRPDSEGIAVGLSSTVYIGMRQVNSIDRTMFSRERRCRRGTDNQSRALSFPGYSAYSPSLCQSECFFEYVINQCGCIERNFYVPISDRYRSTRVCRGTDMCCAIRAFEDVEESCDCPPRCNTVEHRLSISYSTNSKNMVGVNVFQESLIVETRETTDSYSPWSLISDIGGNSGLFLGFTLLSVVELVILVVGLIKDCCCHHKQMIRPVS